MFPDLSWLLNLCMVLDLSVHLSMLQEHVFFLDVVPLNYTCCSAEWQKIYTFSCYPQYRGFEDKLG